MANDGTVKIGAEVDEKEFSSSLSKLGGVAKGAMVGVTAAIGGASAAVGKLAKDSVEAYASYEQLTGGVETLFKESGALVMQYANNAYQTAGLSANQYMETVTSFSASLLQGLGGNTEAAAQMADMAITDMSDNANKMGTDMTSIQNAYQGFAKQNYTLLDNLKLGYGGTQAEMARLINDSGVLGDTIEVTANTVNDVSFDKIIEAIHEVQVRMDISGISAEEAAAAIASGAMTEEEAFAAMGTTAKEAATTIEGSVNSMKAAWENLLTGMASGDQDIEQLTQNLVDSVITVMNNLIPAIQTILPNLTQGLADLIQGLLPFIPTTLQTLLPALIEGATQLTDSFAEVLPAIILAIVTNLPQLLDAAVQIVSTLAQGIINSLPLLIDSAVEIILKLVDLLTNPDNLDEIIDAALQIIVTLAEGLVRAIPKIIEKIPTIIASIVRALIEAIPDILVAGARLGAALIDGIIDSVKSLAKGVVNAVTGIFGGGSSGGAAGGGGRGGRSANMARSASAAEREPAAFSLSAEDGGELPAAAMSRAGMLRSLESAIPAAAERVSVATASMAPAAAWSAPPPMSSGGNAGNSQPAPIILRPNWTINFEGDLAQFAQIMKPKIDAEDIRTGTGVR